MLAAPHGPLGRGAQHRASRVGPPRPPTTPRPCPPHREAAGDGGGEQAPWSLPRGARRGDGRERGAWVRVSMPQAPSEWTESRSQRRPVLLQSPRSDPWEKSFVDRPPRVLEKVHIICANSQELMIHFAHRQPGLVFLFFVLDGPADETLASDSHVMDCAECVAAISKKERNSGDIPSLPPRSLLDHGSHICCFLS